MSNAHSPKIAVIGGGIVGTMTAWQLSQRGAVVHVFDQFNVPNDRGASAGESRIFRTLYKEGTEYVPLLHKSLEKWRELEKSQDSSLLTMCGGLTIGPQNHPDVEAVIACGESEGLEYEVLDSSQLSHRFPHYFVEEDEVGVWDPQAGVFRPEPAVLASRRAAQKLGAVIHSYSPVLHINLLKDAVVLETRNGAARFDSVVIAAGPWADRFSQVTRSIVEPRQLVGMWFAVDQPRDNYRPESMPISIRRSRHGAFSCFPMLDGVSIKILPHHIPWKAISSPESLPRLVDTALVESSERMVAKLLPGVDPSAIRISTWTEGYTPDGAPIVGCSAEDSRVILATGMSGQGFKMSPMIGSIAADFALNGSSDDVPDIFSPTRFAQKEQS